MLSLLIITLLAADAIPQANTAGSAGQCLNSNGAGTVPTWGACGAGGGTDGGTIFYGDQSATPSAPGSGIITYGKSKAESGMFFLRASGRERPIWSDLIAGMQCILPGSGSTPSIVGLPNSATGTITTPAPTTTDLMSSSRHTRCATTGSAGTSAGLRTNIDTVWRGNAAGLGGFTFFARFGFTTAVATQRAFIGMKDDPAVLGNVNPSTLLDSVYVGYDAGGTTLNVCTNDGAGAATCADLGVNFPVNATAVYDVWFFAAPNASSILYYVERWDVAQTASNTISSDLPTSTLFLAPQAWVNNGTTATIAQLELWRMCTDTDI